MSPLIRYWGRRVHLLCGIGCGFRAACRRGRRRKGLRPPAAIAACDASSLGGPPLPQALHCCRWAALGAGT